MGPPFGDGRQNLYRHLAHIFFIHICRYTCGMLGTMATTTVRLDSRTRDRLAAVAREHFGGVSQEAALNRLIDEYEMRQVHAAYARLRDDPSSGPTTSRNFGLQTVQPRMGSAMPATSTPSTTGDPCRHDRAMAGVAG